MIQPDIAGRKWQQEALEILIANKAAGKVNNLIVACPGAGKTRLAMALAKEFIARDEIEKIIIVAPTDNLRNQWVLELNGTAEINVTEGKAYDNEERRKLAVKQYQGFVFTYQTIRQHLDTLKHICKSYKTLVLIDEVHHAGEALPWHSDVTRAFKNRTFSVVLSGTPWRSDGRKMPFVELDQDGFVIADYSYSRRRALVDKNVVRELAFVSVVTQVVTEKFNMVINPVTKEVVDEKSSTASGWVSEWDYGKNLEQEAPSTPHKRSTITAFYKEAAGAGSLVTPTLSDAKMILEAVSSHIKGMALHPSQAVRKIQTDGASSAYEVVPMHKPTMQTKSRYSASIDPTSTSARDLITQAHIKLMEVRETDPTAGGLVVCENQKAAEEFARVLAEVTGEEPELVISDHPTNKDDDPNEKIARFRKSDQKWIVTVKMVSEGVDIKRLRVLAYLSNVLSELFLSQVVGRVTRWRDDLGAADQTAYAFIMAYPPLEDLAYLVDARVLGRLSGSMALPPFPNEPIVCPEFTGSEQSLKPPSMTTRFQQNCRAINSAARSTCWRCGSPLKYRRVSERDTDTNDTHKVGSMWRGISANLEDIEQAQTLQLEDDDLAGISQEIIASIVSKLGVEAARSMGMKYGEVDK